MNVPDLMVAKDRSKVDVKEKKLNLDIKPFFKGKKYFLRTYGCQMNVHDSEEIKYYLVSLGYTAVDVLEDADIVILNTCAIRENAKDKVFGYLGRCKHLKKTKRDLIIAITGCLMQQPKEIEEIHNRHKYIDIIVGTHNLNELPSMIINANQKHLQEIEVYSNSDIVFENVKYNRDSKFSAWINIIYGCDKFCTYCIVPYTRGRERSRKIEEILDEVRDLKNKGYLEITLLGQNVNAYGKDIEGYNYNMANLLSDVAKTGIKRIKFVTSHPWDFTDDMISVIRDNENVLPYVHLPVQSGSNKILKLMGRKYTRESYLELVHKLRENIPNLCLTTDIIVGFPNETDEDFNDTLSIVNECKYDQAYTFIYSKRVGTPAAAMEDSIPILKKEERLQVLNELINKYSLESNKKLLNKVVDVLIDCKSEKEGMLSGYTSNNKLVNVCAPISYIGKIAKVKITECKTWSLDGVLDE